MIALSACQRRVGEVTLIALDWEPQMAYLVDEVLLLEDKEIEVNYDDGKKDTLSLAASGVELSGNGFYRDGSNVLRLDTREAGPKSITISYSGLTVRVQFYVAHLMVREDIGDDEGPIFSSIPLAVDNVVENQHIFVYPGLYKVNENNSETIWFNVKNVSLIGPNYGVSPNHSTTQRVEEAKIMPHEMVGANRVDSPLEHPALYVHWAGDVSNIVIDGFTISGFRNAIISYGDKTIIRNNIIIPEVDYLRNAIQVTGSDSIIEHNLIYGAPLTTGWMGSVIHLIRWDGFERSDRTVVRHNVILGNTDIGITMTNHWNSTEPWTGVKIYNNRIENAKYGISVESFYRVSFTVADLRIENNTITASSNSEGEFVGMRINPWRESRPASYSVTLVNTVMNDNIFTGLDYIIKLYDAGIEPNVQSPVLENFLLNGVLVTESVVAE